MKAVTLAINSLILFFALVSRVGASDASAANQFLGSPFLVLVALFVIDIVAFVYHRLRK